MKLDRIDYNGGEIWVDITRVAVTGERFYFLGTVMDRDMDNAVALQTKNCHPIVAQSITNPSYIDGVPFVEVGGDATELAYKHTEKLLLTSEGRTQRWWGFIEGYEAAQAKQFTEEDLRYAINRVYNYVDGDGWSRDYITEEVFKELKPKVSSIEIDMEEIHGVDRWNVYPKTYQKDGKTFLKVKQ